MDQLRRFAGWLEGWGQLTAATKLPEGGSGSFPKYLRVAGKSITAVFRPPFPPIPFSAAPGQKHMNKPHTL